jgi:hypothetical protein
LTDQPYPSYQPSWIDRLTTWIDRLPAPAWLLYLCLWFLLTLIESGSKWLDGIEPYFKIRTIYIFYTFYGVYFLAAIHYLDGCAKAAFDNFRPALAVDKEGLSNLSHRLITMPARTVWLISAAWLVTTILLYQPLIVPLWKAMGFIHHSTAFLLVDLGIYSFNALMVMIFVYHTLRQLRWISTIHKTATRINLFQLRPLYALSGLTARTAWILILVGTIIAQQAGSHGEITSDRSALVMSEHFTLISILVYSLLAVGVFLLPLIGLHQLLLHEKERLLAEADSRLQAHIQDLHLRIDNRQLQDADAINHHMSSLSLERDILSKLPTWPWQPGTLNLILSAVLLPIILWIAQQFLERWTGL